MDKTNESQIESSQKSDVQNDEMLANNHTLVIKYAIFAAVFLLVVFLGSRVSFSQQKQVNEKVAPDNELELPANVITEVTPVNVAEMDDEKELQRLGLPSVISFDKKRTESGEQAVNGDAMVGHDANVAFMNQAANQSVITSKARVIDELDYKILQGKTFRAVLTHAVNSDLPGMVIAQLTQPVYGFQGKVELLPRGTRLVGVQNSGLSLGSKRIFIAWQRAIRPDGVDIQIGSPSSDAIGQAGSGGFVDTHFWERFRDSAVMSLMGAGVSAINSADDANMYQQAVTSAALNESSKSLSRTAQMKPTIYIDQGTIINVMIARDLDFSEALL